MSSNNEAIVIPHINSLSLSKDILHYIYSNYRAIKVKILYLYKALVRKIYFSLLLFFITILFAIIICCHKFDGDFIRMKLFKCVKFYFFKQNLLHRRKYFCCLLQKYLHSQFFIFDSFYTS